MPFSIYRWGKLQNLIPVKAVVSSKHSTALKRNLEFLEIASYFEGVIGSDQVENYKPAPDVT